MVESLPTGRALDGLVLNFSATRDYSPIACDCWLSYWLLPARGKAFHRGIKLGGLKLERLDHSPARTDTVGVVRALARWFCGRMQRFRHPQHKCSRRYKLLLLITRVVTWGDLSDTSAPGHLRVARRPDRSLRLTHRGGFVQWFADGIAPHMKSFSGPNMAMITPCSRLFRRPLLFASVDSYHDARCCR